MVEAVAPPVEAETNGALDQDALRAALAVAESAARVKAEAEEMKQFKFKE